MAGSIQLELNQWESILKELRKDYPLSYTLVSWVTKRELGFTIRNHRDTYGARVVCLDFWDDHLETIFRLKYL
jgi:hypothetical protein